MFLVDTATAQLRRHLDVAESAVASLEFSPDGTLLAAGRLDGRTLLYDVSTSEAAGPPLAASASAITDVSFSHDGTRLATASADRTGAFWRLDGGRAIGTALDGHDAPVTEAAFSEDGTSLVTGGLDAMIAVRDASTGAVTATIDTAGEVLSVAIDPSGGRLAAGTTSGVVLAALNGSDRRTIDVGEGWAHQVAFTPDGATLAIGIDPDRGQMLSHEPGVVLFVDSRTGKPYGAPLELEEGVIGVDISPDGRSIAVVVANNVLHFFDIATRVEIVPAIENPDALITSVAYSPDGTRFAIAVSTGAVRQYDAVTHQPIGQPLDGDPNGIFGVAYSPDGTLLAGTSLGFSTTRLWDARTGAALGTRLTGGRVPYSYQTFTVEHLMASRPAFAPSGHALAAPGFTNASVLWDLDPAHWRTAACTSAGRDLTPEEWARYLPGRDVRPLCSA